MVIPELIKELERMAEIAKEQGYDPRFVNVSFSWANCPAGTTGADVNFADFEKPDDGGFSEHPEVILKH
jgi:hypothetical protein